MTPPIITNIQKNNPVRKNSKVFDKNSCIQNSIFPVSQPDAQKQTPNDNNEKLKLILNITGLSKTQYNNLNQKALDELDKIVECAIKDAPSTNGEKNWDEIKKTANRYYIAVKTEWTIEEYKKANAKNQENLNQRMERFFGLEKGSFEKLPQDKIQSYLMRYFNNFFVDKLKNATSIEEKESIYKTQIKDFGKLLSNTSDENKAIFKQAITALVVSNRIKGLDAVLASFGSQESRTKFVNSYTVEEEKALALTPDVEGNTMSQEDVTTATAKLAAQRDEAGSENHHKELEKDVTKFYEDNKEALEILAKKEANGETLTDEEKKLKQERDNFYTAAQAGEISGTAINQVLSVQAKEKLLVKMNEDAYKHPNYKEVLTQVDKFIENHPEELTASKKEIINLLDKATDGKYTKVTTQSSEAMAKPESAKKESGSTEFVNTKSQQEIIALQKSVTETKANLSAASDKESKNFIVETPEKISTSQVYKMKNNAIQSESHINEYLDVTGQTKFEFAKMVFKDFNKAGTTTQLWATNLFSNMSTAAQKLFAQNLTTSRTGILAIAKDVDLEKLNLFGVSITTRKEAEKIQKTKGFTEYTA